MDHRQVFEAAKNDAIGAEVDRTYFFRPHSTTRVSENRIEYGFDYGRGCAVAFLVDATSRSILSWRILESQSSAGAIGRPYRGLRRASIALL
jgi:hypothetical protein